MLQKTRDTIGLTFTTMSPNVPINAFYHAMAIPFGQAIILRDESAFFEPTFFNRMGPPEQQLCLLFTNMPDTN